MQFAVKITPADAREFFRFIVFRRYRWLLPFLIVLCGCLAVLYSIQGDGTLNMRTFVFVLGGGFLGIVLITVLQIYQVDRIARRRSAEDPYFKYENQFTFSDDEVGYTNEISSLHVKVQDIQRVRCTRNLFIAYFSKVNALVFPADSLPPDFAEWLRERSQSTRRSHRRGHHEGPGGDKTP